MPTTKKQKSQFKVRIFDLQNKNENLAFTVYEKEGEAKLTLEEFKKKLEDFSNKGD